MGYLVVPPHLVKAFTVLKGLNDKQSPMIEQRLLGEFTRRGMLRRQQLRLWRHYERKRLQIMDAVEKHLQGIARVCSDTALGGLHMEVEFLEEIDEAQVHALARECGLLVADRDGVHLQEPWRARMTIGYANAPSEQLESAVEMFGTKLRQLLWNCP
jgi:GntR family transcriptional regulator/MocR family aminotransferase